MFVAALLDAFPEYWPRVQSTIASLNLGAEAECRLAPHRDDAFAGSRFLVAGERTASEQPTGSQRTNSPDDPSHPHEGSGHHEHAHSHPDRGGERAWADIRAELARSGLDADVKKHAVAIFELLAKAEAKVHGVEAESVTFHEIGAVDSIVDIVAAAQLIALIRSDRWTSAPLPIGSGRINTAHGVLPAPAPAVALLLQGLHRHRRRRSGRAGHADGRRACALSRRRRGAPGRAHSPAVAQRRRIWRANSAGHQQLSARVGVRRSDGRDARDGRRRYRSPAIGGHRLRGRRSMPGGFGGRTRPHPCAAGRFRRDPEFRRR